MNRIVMITGSTRGIGFSTAAEFLKGDDRVVIFCRHKEHVTKAIAQLTGFGDRENIFGLVGDVRPNPIACRCDGRYRYPDLCRFAWSCEHKIELGS